MQNGILDKKNNFKMLKSPSIIMKKSIIALLWKETVITDY